MRSKSVLLTKTKTRVFHCRIGEDLHRRIQGVQAQLKQLGDAVFPVDQIVEEALQRAMRLAEAELAKRANPKPAAHAG